MKLCLTDNRDYIYGDLYFYVTQDTAVLSMLIDNKKSLEEQLNDKDKICSALEEELNVLNQQDEMSIFDGESIEKIEDVLENYDIFKNMLDTIEYVELQFSNTDVDKYICDNPILSNKKIILDYNYSISDYDKIMDLIDYYKDDLGKYFVHLEGNGDYVSLADCQKIMNKIKYDTDEIKKLGLSPMEIAMYVYDKVRKRVYVKGDIDDDYSESRDLAKVMYGDKIVCVGYANLFHAYVTNLGIKDNVITLLKKKNKLLGHARNLAYIKDPKYGIDGVYFFDATWDSKRADSNSYLNSYRCFALTFGDMDAVSGHALRPTSMSMYSCDMFDKFKKLITNNESKKIWKYVLTMSNMAMLVGNDKVFDIDDIAYCMRMNNFESLDLDTIYKKFMPTFNKFNEKIPSKTMLDLLNTVRKIEHAEDPKLYLYSEEELRNIYISSGWESVMTPEQRLLKSLFDAGGNDFDNDKNELGLFQDEFCFEPQKVLKK